MREESERHREEILRQATRLFAEKGYAGASIRELTENTGLTRPTIYYHFGGKRGLYLEVLRRCSERFQNMLAMCHGFHDQPGQQLRCIIGTEIDSCRKDRHMVRVLAEAMRSDEPDACQMAAQSLEAIRAAVSRCIEKGVESGEFVPVDPPTVSLVIIGALASCIAWAEAPAREPTLGIPLSGVMLDLLPDLLVRLVSQRGEAPAGDVGGRDALGARRNA